MDKSLVLLLMLVLAVGLVGTDFPQKSPEVEVRFIMIILKVEPDTIVMPEGRYKAPIDEIEIKSGALRELNKKFNLISIERMYAKKTEGEEGEGDLENTFLLKFPELIDLEVIIDEYNKLKDVIYAEENQVVEIF